MHIPIADCLVDQRRVNNSGRTNRVEAGEAEALPFFLGAEVHHGTRCCFLVTILPQIQLSTALMSLPAPNMDGG